MSVGVPIGRDECMSSPLELREFLRRILADPLLAIATLPFLPFMVLMCALQGSSPSPKLQNIEEIVWEDWKGRKRSISIHRKVE